MSEVILPEPTPFQDLPEEDIDTPIEDGEDEDVFFTDEKKSIVNEFKNIQESIATINPLQKVTTIIKESREYLVLSKSRFAKFVNNIKNVGVLKNMLIEKIASLRRSNIRGDLVAQNREIQETIYIGEKMGEALNLGLIKILAVFLFGFGLLTTGFLLTIAKLVGAINASGHKLMKNKQNRELINSVHPTLEAGFNDTGNFDSTFGEKIDKSTLPIPSKLDRYRFKSNTKKGLIN